ncbi:MAG: non-heme iron oxygenase ferredoxin subunit [Candidatus Caldarchaeum sp.]|nr:non-heme iron oxygenase ferredoxin subunit [Candidatus Caldarchaeum sp.]MDW8360109.1 non-heme iron oxygenase ferredoxin subunit [Candidatus Caldarchaeum sp.]
MARLVKVCKASDIDEGGSTVVDVEGEQILLLKHAGRFYAVSNICTHDYAELSNGLLMEGTITCPVHLSRFRLDTGEVLNPPAEKPLKAYRVVLEGDSLYVEV